MKEKKQLTIKQQKNKYRNTKIALRGSEYLSVATPYAIMAGVNHNEWFAINPEPWKVGLGGSIGLVLVALSIALVHHQQNADKERKVTDAMIGLILFWYAIAFVFFLLAQINMEIYKIMMYGGLGLVGALGLEFGAENMETKQKKKQKALEEADLRVDTEQAIEEKKIKVRIKD